MGGSHSVQVVHVVVVVARRPKQLKRQVTFKPELATVQLITEHVPLNMKVVDSPCL